MERADLPGLWDYAVALYGHPSVAEAALTLQDASGADVNVILLCVWLGQRRLRLEPVLPTVLEISARWQTSVIQPLRQCRRTLKTLPTPAGLPSSTLHKLREDVKASELEAERLEVMALSSAVENLHMLPGEGEPDSRTTAQNNLAVYFAGAGLPSGLLGQAPVLRILDSASGR